MTEARQALADTESRVDELQTNAARLWADFAARDAPAQRALLEQQRLDAVSALEEIQNEVVTRRQQIRDIREEARRVGVLPRLRLVDCPLVDSGSLSAGHHLGVASLHLCRDNLLETMPDIPPMAKRVSKAPGPFSVELTTRLALSSHPRHDRTCGDLVCVVDVEMDG